MALLVQKVLGEKKKLLKPGFGDIRLKKVAGATLQKNKIIAASLRTYMYRLYFDKCGGPTREPYGRPVSCNQAQGQNTPGTS